MTLSKAEEKIRFVVTMFRVLAWPFAVLFVPAAILTVPAVLYRAVSDPETSLGGSLLIAVMVVLFAAVPVSMLSIAGRLRRGDPSVKRSAMLIAVVLLFIAFPVSTFAGLFFLSRLGRYYNVYCQQLAAAA